jgi:hypothetical protein
MRPKFLNDVVYFLKWMYYNTIRKFYIIYKKHKSSFIIVPELFNGKRVAIIGPADSALSKKNGNYIDSYDIVIRFNKSVEIINIHAEFTGTKTTYLAHCLDEADLTGCGKINTKLWKHRGVEKVMYLLNEKRFDPNLDVFFLKNIARLPVFQINKIDYQNLKNSLNGKIPTTGCAALFILLNSNCSQLYISGFTFFKTEYQVGYRPNLKDFVEMRQMIKGHLNHDVDKEFHFIRDLINSSNLDIELDDKLRELMKL